MCSASKCRIGCSITKAVHTTDPNGPREVKYSPPKIFGTHVKYRGARLFPSSSTHVLVPLRC